MSGNISFTNDMSFNAPVVDSASDIPIHLLNPKAAEIAKKMDRLRKDYLEKMNELKARLDDLSQRSKSHSQNLSSRITDSSSCLQHITCFTPQEPRNHRSQNGDDRMILDSDDSEPPPAQLADVFKPGQSTGGIQNNGLFLPGHPGDFGIIKDHIYVQPNSCFIQPQRPALPKDPLFTQKLEESKDSSDLSEASHLSLTNESDFVSPEVQGKKRKKTLPENGAKPEKRKKHNESSIPKRVSRPSRARDVTRKKHFFEITKKAFPIGAEVFMLSPIGKNVVITGYDDTNFKLKVRTEKGDEMSGDVNKFIYIPLEGEKVFIRKSRYDYVPTTIKGVRIGTKDDQSFPVRSMTVCYVNDHREKEKKVRTLSSLLPNSAALRKLIKPVKNKGAINGMELYRFPFEIAK